MKKATLVIWVIIFGFIALIIFQNQTFFLAKETYRINIGITDEYVSPAIPNAVVTLIFFFFGLLVSFLFSFSARFKAQRTIKRLNSSVTTQATELTQLKSEVNKLKGIEEPVDSHADTIKLDLNTTQKIHADSPADSAGDKTVKFDTAETTDNPESDDKENSDEKKD